MRAGALTVLVAVAALGLTALAAAQRSPAGGSAGGPGRSAPTFTRDVAPILFANCASCHRAGEVAPFPLFTYQDAKKRAALIAAVTERRLMPPWKADSHGEFQNERRLTEAQIATLKEWAARGAPEGDPKALPPAPRFASDWTLGAPDLVLEHGDSYTVAAEGRDEYRCFVSRPPLRKTGTSRPSTCAPATARWSTT